MDTGAFLSDLATMWDGDPQYSDHPRDRRFLSVLDATGGMATENKLALLNGAAKCLEDEEIYLEVGAWTGCSIIGASLGHDDKRFVTIDDFSQFGSPRVEFWLNVQTFGADHVELIDGNVWDVLSARPFSSPIGVYFYDGGHTYSDQYRALQAIEPMLADEALVIVDDTAWSRVALANRQFVEHRPQFQRVLRFESPRNGEPRWWNGVEVYVHRRARSPRTLGRFTAVAMDHVHLGGRRLAARLPGLARARARLLRTGSTGPGASPPTR